MIQNAQASDKVLSSMQYDRVLVLTDRNVDLNVWPMMKLLHAYPKIIIEPGETSKSQTTATNILKQMHSNGLSRESLLIGLGGGVVTDLAGYCASIYMRGIDVIHVPTSLLAMVDAAIGGKTGINTEWGKNMVGTFHKPKAILYYQDVLQSLPERQFKSGFVEAWKTTIMCTPEIWEDVQYPLTYDQITQTANTKQTLVERDFRDKGNRAWLNFGHSFGHAFEHLYHREHGILHGEAIAWGMLAEFYLTKEETPYRKYWAKWVENNIPKLPYTPKQKDHVLDLIKSDKKNSVDVQRFSLPYLSGSRVQAFDEQELVIALEKLWMDYLK